MEGVTILATDVVTMTNPIMNIILIITCVIAAIGFLFFILGIAIDCARVGVTGLVLLVITFVVIIISIPIDRMTQVPDYNTYEVILDDSVSMNEFMNTYEVLEQRGRIYVVKEIEE
jgi:hypothetical protein